MLTDFEQRIYNTHLAISRSSLGKPFTLRKDFSDLVESDLNYQCIKKLSRFFSKHSQIDIGVYFKSPYEIYKDGEHYDLKFFVTQKAISVYSMYMKRLQEQSPDSEDQFEIIRKSLAFIIRFCCDEHIPFSDYITYKKPNAVMEEFLSHYKNGNVSLYVLLRIPKFEKIAYSLDEELRELFFGNILDNLSSFKIKLHQSVKSKKLIEDTLKKILILTP